MCAEMMVQANLGFAAQYAATNTDPITNLADHLKVNYPFLTSSFISVWTSLLCNELSNIYLATILPYCLKFDSMYAEFRYSVCI